MMPDVNTSTTGQQGVVNLIVVGDADCPVAFIFNIFEPLASELVRFTRLANHLNSRLGQRMLIPGPEQPAVFPVPDQLLVTAHIGCQHQFFLRHCFQWF